MKEITKEKIVEIININMENAEILIEQAEEDLSNLGMDSIAFIRIIVSLEEEFECEVPDSKLLLTEMNTVNKIYEVLTSIESNFVG